MKQLALKRQTGQIKPVLWAMGENTLLQKQFKDDYVEIRQTALQHCNCSFPKKCTTITLQRYLNTKKKKNTFRNANDVKNIQKTGKNRLHRKN